MTANMTLEMKQAGDKWNVSMRTVTHDEQTFEFATEDAARSALERSLAAAETLRAQGTVKSIEVRGNVA